VSSACVLSRSDVAASAQINSPAATTAKTPLTHTHGFRRRLGAASVGEVTDGSSCGSSFDTRRSSRAVHAATTCTHHSTRCRRELGRVDATRNLARAADRPIRHIPPVSEPSLPTVRESADALGIRLARIGAAATTLRGLTADLRATSSREALLTLLDGLERDLAFASRDLLLAREAARQQLDA
jgi:hypothetical protein